MMFSAIWTLVKGFLDEKTRAKIKIEGTKYIKELLKLIDIENIPSFMGGQCTCEEGCLSSNAGPWTQYEN